MSELLGLLGGGLLLYFGAEWFVGGASALALGLRVPKIIIGLTVVAYGTSAPEVIVGIQAAHAGHGDVALGNVIGSNTANIGLILGLAALTRPAHVDGALRRRELPVLVLSTALVPALLWDGRVSELEGLGLLALAAAYTGWMVYAARSTITLSTAASDTLVTAELADAAGAPHPGGVLFVDGAVSVARAWGMSDRLVGLTIVAIGTSLPELVTSLIAARRGHSDLAVGNVIGSNIFNTLLCLGSAALSGQVGVPLASAAFDLGALTLMTMLAAIFIRSARTISRVEGGVLLACYGGLSAFTILRG